MVDKKYDIVVHGASGFTGKLICEYLYINNDKENIKWCISGRNEDKLSTIAKKYNIDYLVADAYDKQKLDFITNQAKLIISVVGPYSIYGKDLVQSCIDNSCHYLDLTGEPEFVNYIENKYSELALSNNIIIINCCGFESIPPDIGVFYTLKYLKEENAVINSYLTTKGQISGGTWASFLNSFSSNKSIIKKSSGIKRKTKKIFFNKYLKKWALIFPVIDKYIVKKSSKNLNGYGKKFSFNEYILLNNRIQIFTLITSLFLIGLLCKIKFIRKILMNIIPSGSGPDKAQRENHWFNIKLFAKSENKSIITTIKGGDPGYGETAKFISEMGLCIINDYENLNLKKGVITPAMCAGDLMINRLQKSGITFKHEINKN
tara:strand:- start:7214 stop:8338 length:1125 start_codon:yes stop_codon:yes gene_type:complete